MKSGHLDDDDKHLLMAKVEIALMPQLYIGIHAYLTKIHLLGLKEQIGMPFKYVRADFDKIIITVDKKTTVTVSQDGLILLKTSSSPENIDKWHGWLLRHIVAKLMVLDEEDAFFKNILQKNRPTIVYIGGKKSDFEKLGKKLDYSIKSQHMTKHYGDGLVVIENMKLKGVKLEEYLATQVFFCDYQAIVQELINYNKQLWQKVTSVRARGTYRFKELPPIIDELLEEKRMCTVITKRIEQLDDFIMERKSKCTIKNVLDPLKLYDFDEMVRLNNYVRDQLLMTNEYISSTMSLIEFIYKDNEQKELNILQVIFAVGTIATVVSLGAMPGAKLFLEMQGNTIVGEMVAFSSNDLIFWTIISVVIGIVLFMILNYFFLSAKKLRIVSLLKDKKSNSK